MRPARRTVIAQGSTAGWAANTGWLFSQAHSSARSAAARARSPARSPGTPTSCVTTSRAPAPTDSIRIWSSVAREMVTYSPGILPRPSRSATASRCRQSSGPTRTRLTGRPEDSLSCTARHNGASSADSSDTGFTVVQHKHPPINPGTPNPGGHLLGWHRRQEDCDASWSRSSGSISR